MRLILCVIIILVTAACQKTHPEKFQHTIFIFGTLLEITLTDIEPELAETAFEQLEKDYRAYHDSWSPWQESDLSRINKALNEGSKIVPAAGLLPLIKQSIILSEQSNNLFNPAIGNLINLWQFHKHEDPDIRPPNDAAIKKIRNTYPKMQDLSFDGDYLSSTNPAVQLNFGAFAKGYAVDLSFAKLQNLGIKNAIINAGGDLRASGAFGDRPWNIGIRHPRSETIIASIEVQDGESVFTSGDYERYFEYNNTRYHHILDAITGYPTLGTSSVTVLHESAAIADAAATALMVAGPKRWQQVAKNMGISHVLLITEDNTIHMTPKMAKRIKLKDSSNYSIVLSQPL